VLTKDGLTVVKGGWGRFAQIRGTNEMEYLNPLSLKSTNFVWRDLNGNRNYDAGEVNLDPNGADYVSQTGTTTAILNSNESTPITDEFSVSLERQLAQNMAIRVSGIYTRSSNNAIVLNPKLPGPIRIQSRTESSGPPTIRARRSPVGSEEARP
jgi:hypothetical protein